MARFCKEEMKEHGSSFDEYLYFHLAISQIGFSEPIIVVNIITIITGGFKRANQFFMYITVD